MEKGQMKNIVILRNLPSNLVEEAIVIIKSNKVARKFEYIERKESSQKKKNGQQKDYVIREAESVISNYINNIEKKSYGKNKKKKENKIKALKIYSVCITILFLLAVVIGDVLF